MNATTIWRGWMFHPARRLTLKRKALGFVLYEAGRRPGVPAQVANAHARFEYEAKRAAREWLMV
ncbi:MAG TPA: hypothetical protein VFP36_02405 [Usitatibacter sp.]|nr:hypothetical protein [Usitatibacter sp.]